jgi:hypothetical protein
MKLAAIVSEYNELTFIVASRENSQAHAFLWGQIVFVNNSSFYG